MFSQRHRLINSKIIIILVQRVKFYLKTKQVFSLWPVVNKIIFTRRFCGITDTEATIVQSEYVAFTRKCVGWSPSVSGLYLRYKVKLLQGLFPGLLELLLVQRGGGLLNPWFGCLTAQFRFSEWMIFSSYVIIIITKMNRYIAPALSRI